MIFSIIIYFLLVGVYGLTSITFEENEKKLDLSNKNNFIYLCNFERGSGYKYLYIYPQNYMESGSYKHIFKIYFKEIKSEDSFQDTSLDYLSSDYSSIDFNAGLFIELSKLKYDKGILYVFSYQTCNFYLFYKYTNDIIFPAYSHYSNFQLNQFILSKGATTNPINYRITNGDNNYLLIFSKTSLRNIEVKAIYNNEKDITDEKLAYLYPNGCSIFLEYKEITNKYISVTITNKNNHDDVILLGTVHHIENQIFPNEVVNGFQIYIEGNRNDLNNLLINGQSGMKQYFLTQIYNKNLFIFFSAKRYPLTEYNSMFPYSVETSQKITFGFGSTPKRSALNFQYIDYSENEIAQKSLQSLVTGVPKTMTIHNGNYMYHFLPKERKSSNLYFYLKPRTQEKIFISFNSCISYPEGCSFTENGNLGAEVIQNIGLWYSLPRTNMNELQLILAYCENLCSYDILMQYEESDPMFLFPENDYSKFISSSAESDIYALPVFEYFETSEKKSINIELTVISGNAELTLKNSRDGKKLEYNMIKTGNRQSYTISSETFLNDQNYYKKEIYAVVTKDNNYKNTFYNIMYGSSTESNSKFLSNNIVNIDNLIVAAKGSEAEESRIFTFINNNQESNLFISISSRLCKSKIAINNTAQADEDYNHLYSVTQGSSDIKIYLINDNNLCKKGFQDEIKLFSYYPNDNILLSENTLFNATISNIISFVHIFKPNTEENYDNSFNIELEKLNEIPVTFSYELKKISFDQLSNSKSSGLSKSKLNSRKIRFISNKEINNICGSLKDYEICQLVMNFEPSSSSTLSSPSKFSLNLNKNGRYISKEIYNNNLISAANAKTTQYFYIDIINDNNIELLINSFGQDIKVHYELKTTEQDDSKALPLKESFTSGSNRHQIQIEKSKFSKCSDFCRLYIGVISSQDKNAEEISSTFSIGYHYYDDEKISKSDIYLPLNYWTQYTFNNLNEINFYVLNPINNAKLTFELYINKQNENDNSTVSATVEGGASLQLTSDSRKIVTGTLDKINIVVKNNDANRKPTFKFRVSSIGTQNIIPLIPSYEEKCLDSPPCYYLLDDFVLENQEQSAYFYIPDSETSVINYLDLTSDKDISITGTYSSSIEDFKRSNWLEYKIPSKNHSLVIKMEKVGSLLASYFNKPNEVTLNFGEKRMFTIRRGSSSSESITIKINREGTDNSKYIINLHAVKGNGYIKSQNQNYALGFENAYKEDITIIFDNDKKYDMVLEVINKKFDKVDNSNDFAFTIEYTIDTGKGLKYPITFDKMNSINFYKSAGLEEFSFYLDRNSITSEGLDMNIKIYSSSYYNIKAYFADANQNCKIDSNELDDKIKTFIEGGEFTFSKLEVTSELLGKNSIQEFPYIFVQINVKESSKASNVVKIDLYPYDMKGTNHILLRDELFIQKLPGNTADYQLFLGKSEINYGSDAKIYFIHPLSDKYKKAIAQTDDGKKIIKEDEQGLVHLSDDKYGFDKYRLDIGTDKKQKYISFNIYAEDNNKEANEDSFIFSYQNPRDEDDYLYIPEKLEFNVTGKEKSMEFGLIGFKPKYDTGKNIFIINAYKEDDIKNCKDLGDEYKSLYLLFNKKPAYTIYQELILNSETGTKKTIQDTKIKSGQYYFTGVSVLKDNGREQYIGYVGKSHKVEGSSKFGELLDYMKQHVLASVLIIIILLFILGIMVNICRAERKGGRISSVKVELDGQLMDDKA